MLDATRSTQQQQQQKGDVMKKVLFSTLCILFVFSAAQTAWAQCEDPTGAMCSTPPATTYSFGAAKAHAHGTGQGFTDTGYYCGRGLINDSTNNGGNIFLGNEICVVSDSDFQQHWYWYDWSADVGATEKLSAWRSNYPYQWVSVDVYDSTCLLGSRAYNPWTGGI